MRLRVATRRISWFTPFGHERTRRTLEFWLETGDPIRWPLRRYVSRRSETLVVGPETQTSDWKGPENEADSLQLAADL